eukprot:TRINITY_DN11289_c0_g1_i4.p1 TRINITY_DN11289_c0_g1~~TRINITY_DN11289_c0_g1_i4.p1  ORF type:complete len:353 (+),score=25.63 TRINITY_DN11289_c0_g1_i4:109-1167(+)
MLRVQLTFCVLLASFLLSEYDFSVFKQRRNVKFKIIHFNDFHGRVEPQTEWWNDCNYDTDKNGQCFGGISRMKSIIDYERSLNDMPLLVLNAGDDFVGTAWDYNWRYQGSKAMAHFMNLLGVDVMTLGNHDFDRGPEELAQYVSQLNSDVISCNARTEAYENLDKHTQSYVIKELPGGIKVGIVGFTVESTPDYSNPWPVWFENKDMAGQRCIQQIKNQGVDIIILLDHIGFGGDKRQAMVANHVDLVIGGHSHILLSSDGVPRLNQYSGSKDEVESNYPTWVWSTTQQKDVPVLQCGYFSRYLCKVEVEFDPNGNLVSIQGGPILLGGQESDNDVYGDEEAWKQINSWKYW